MAREVCRLLTGPQEPLPDARDLASRRRSSGTRQADVAERMGVNMHGVSKAERGVTIDGALLRDYDALPTELERAAEEDLAEGH